MDSDELASNKICNLIMLKENYQFNVVSNHFRLIEDGILRIPFLTKYQYNVTNNKLTLHEIILSFQNIR